MNYLCDYIFVGNHQRTNVNYLAQKTEWASVCSLYVSRLQQLLADSIYDRNSLNKKETRETTTNRDIH